MASAKEKLDILENKLKNSRLKTDDFMKNLARRNIRSARERLIVRIQLIK